MKWYDSTEVVHDFLYIIAWAVLSDEQMRKIWPFSLLNDEQMSNTVGVEHQPAIKIGDLGGWVPLFLEGHPCGGSKTQLFQTVFQTVFQKQISTILLIRPN